MHFLILTPFVAASRPLSNDNLLSSVAINWLLQGIVRVEFHNQVSSPSLTNDKKQYTNNHTGEMTSSPNDVTTQDSNHNCTAEEASAFP